MNNKANTYQIWVELILFIILFLGIMAIIGADMNTKYGKSNDLTLGMNLSSSLTELQGYKTDLQNSTTSGQVSVTDFGILKLLTTPAMIVKVTGVIWNFVSGQFIYTLVSQMNIGAYGSIIATVFRILYIIAIGFILIKLVLRINI